VSAELIIALPIGFVIGLALGMLGAGGGVLTVPALIYVLGEPVAVAVTASLGMVSSNAATGAALAWRDRLVDVRTAGFFLVGALPAAVAGSLVSEAVSGDLILVVLSVLMVAAAAALVKRPYTPPESNRSARVSIPVGLGIGFLTGLSGVGGGFLIVPALVLLVGLRTQVAIGTSLAVISLTSLTGLVTHLTQADDLPWLLLAVLIAAGMSGAAVGARLNRRTSDTRLDRLFATLLVVLGIVILVATLT
jgi:uncharacterized membrane protein YfcA